MISQELQRFFSAAIMNDDVALSERARDTTRRLEKLLLLEKMLSK
jgi:hypothetical protein